jgi:uncharacterized membrane protein
MLYLWLKFIHIVSSTILFGTGLGTAFTLFMAHKTRDLHIITATTRYVVFADWLFTGTSGIVQPVTGFFMVHIGGLSFTTPWIMGSIIGYSIAACCWFIVVYLQIKMRIWQPARNKQAHHYPLGIFAILIIGFYWAGPHS